MQSFTIMKLMIVELGYDIRNVETIFSMIGPRMGQE